MTRDDVLRIFADAQEEQLDELMQMHEAELAAAEEELRQLTAQVEALQQQEAQRKEEQRLADERAALEKRFDAAVGDRKFVHEAVRQSVLNEFIELRKDPANEAVGDEQLLERLTAGMGCFERQYQPVVMAEMGSVNIEDMEKMSDAEYYDAVRRKYMR